MPNIIKLLEGLQLSQEKVKQIEEVATWLSGNVRERVVTNSQEIALSGGKENYV